MASHARGREDTCDHGLFRRSRRVNKTSYKLSWKTKIDEKKSKNKRLLQQSKINNYFQGLSSTLVLFSFSYRLPYQRPRFANAPDGFPFRRNFRINFFGIGVVSPFHRSGIGGPSRAVEIARTARILSSGGTSHWAVVPRFAERRQALRVWLSRACGFLGVKVGEKKAVVFINGGWKRTETHCIKGCRKNTFEREKFALSQPSATRFLSPLVLMQAETCGDIEHVSSPSNTTYS